MTNKEVVEKTTAVLNENPEWVKRYKDYADAIRANQKEYEKRRFQPRKPIQVYSSITRAKDGKKTYDLRFAGQSIGVVTVDKTGEVTLNNEGKTKSDKKVFGYTKLLKDVPWGEEEAKAFRKFYDDLKATDTEKNSQKEHMIESLILTEFGKKTRALGKKLCNIRPVELCKKYFQLSTPLSASNHGKDPKYSKDKGGGIDILARIKDLKNKSQLVIIELKDENKDSECQEVVMFQALTYATFIAHLLRSESGKDWWELFGFHDNRVKDALTIDLYVATLMPKGSSKEGDREPIPVEGKNVILHPCTLYYETDEEGNITGFSEGTLLEKIKA